MNARAPRKRSQPSDGPGPVTDEMFSPPNILELVRRVAPIAVDPCTTLANPTGAAVIGVAPWSYDTGPRDAMGIIQSNGSKVIARDGLSLTFNWSRMAGIYGGLVYVNWPYSRSLPWATRSRNESLAGAEVIALCMASTADGWFQSQCVPRRSAAMCFLRGRQRFYHNGKRLDAARFMSCVVYYGPRRYRFADAFADAGAIWI